MTAPVSGTVVFSNNSTVVVKTDTGLSRYIWDEHTAKYVKRSI
jgi:hypothetical protein